ncbi:MAG TPA: hypothetical protein VHE78_00645 [Gemmatimonadaceae bacterium]|nr:hypothetical protein [Gemmatimonadaceae bacterium]
MRRRIETRLEDAGIARLGDRNGPSLEVTLNVLPPAAGLTTASARVLMRLLAQPMTGGAVASVLWGGVSSKIDLPSMRSLSPAVTKAVDDLLVRFLQAKETAPPLAPNR